MPGFIFEVATFSRTFRLAAATEAERAAWMAQLVAGIEKRTGIKPKVYPAVFQPPIVKVDGCGGC